MDSFQFAPRFSVPVRIYLGLVVFSLAGTALSRFAKLDPGPIAPVTATLTLAVGLWAAFGWEWFASRSKLGILIAVGFVGALSEVAGVLTGLPFGKYVYTDRWWPTIPLTETSRFPLLLPFAWLLVAGAAWRGMPFRGPLRVIAGAALATAVDLIMEPVMVGALGYWKWLEGGPLPGGAPVQNALGWFAISGLGGIVLESFSKETGESSDARWVLLGQTVLTLGLGLLLAG